MDLTLGETSMARLKGLDSTTRHNNYTFGGGGERGEKKALILLLFPTKCKDTKIELLQE